MFQEKTKMEYTFRNLMYNINIWDSTISIMKPKTRQTEKPQAEYTLPIANNYGS